MIGNTALAVGAASSDTRIYATVARTSAVARTITAQNTFRSTRTVRIADVIGWTDTIYTASWRFFALCVGAARMRLAWPLWFDDIWLNYIFKINIPYRSKYEDDGAKT
jgi:hypothetical protein